MTKYQVEATFSYTGYVEVEAESAQEAVGYVRDKGNSYSVHDACDRDVEIEDVYNENGSTIKEQWG